MKVSSSIKRICKACKVIKRNNILFIYCAIHLKHKQRQG